MASSSSVMLKFRGIREGFRPLSVTDLEKVRRYEASTGTEIQEIDESSAGCVVFSRHPDTKQLMVLLLHNYGNWYSFPKGHVDEGEDDITAAMRETLEETGVKLTKEQLDSQGIAVRYALFNKLHKDRWEKHPQYPNESKRPKVIGYKTVVHFSAYTEDQHCTAQLEEVAGAKFYLLEEALQLLSDVIRVQLEEHLKTPFVQNLMSVSK